MTRGVGLDDRAQLSAADEPGAQVGDVAFDGGKIHAG
jgi:hypothetical protein